MCVSCQTASSFDFAQDEAWVQFEFLRKDVTSGLKVRNLILSEVEG